MKNDFKKMETEMDLLASNMESITSFSDQISSTLQDTRQQISKLSGVHVLLKRLQFLFKLPTTLKARMEEDNYTQVLIFFLISTIIENLSFSNFFRQYKIIFMHRECFNNMETCPHSKVFKKTVKLF